MDSFAVDPVKSEKSIAMRRYRRIQKLASIFRCVEVFTALVFLTWLSCRLPIAIRISGDLFKQLLVVAISPSFVFIVGNAIIITLVAKSGQFSVWDPSGTASADSTDLYEEFVKSSESRAKARTEEIAYQDKAVVTESRLENKEASTCTDKKKDYRRCGSERTVRPEKKKSELRRSETDTSRIMENLGETESCSDADMSNEEFRRKVEEFIAKQQKFRREESMSIVLYDPN